MKFSVHIIADAEQDILDIYRYVARNDSEGKAARLFDNLERTISKLSTTPERGHCPPELERAGVRDYREIFFKRYRIIYQIIRSGVYVQCVLDCRRDLHGLLEDRLMR